MKRMFQLLGVFMLCVCPVFAQPVPKIVFGTNVAGISSETREVPFVDIMKYARSWNTKNITWVNGGRNPWNTDLADSVDFDAQGYPLEMPVYLASAETLQKVFTGWYDLSALPKGDYVVLWDGDGEIEITGDAQISLVAPNRMIVRVIQNAEGNGLIELSIRRSNRANRVRNIRFLLPGAEATYQQNPFNPVWLNKLELFSAVRFMDWGRTNNWGYENSWDVFPTNGGDSLKVSWENRSHVDYFTFSSNKGVPYEYMVSLGNLTKKDIWICVPHSADNGYIRSLAEYLRENVDPERKIYIEYSNEVWNWMFAQTHWLKLWGCDAKGISWPEGIVPYIQNTFDIFSDVFKNDMNRIVRVAAVQGGWFDVANRVVSNLRPGSYDAVSPAAYFGLHEAGDNRFDLMGNAVTPKNVFDEVFQSRGKGEMPWLRDIKTGIADVKNVPMLYYEGGQHLTPTPFGEEPSYAKALIDIQRDTLMYTLYTSWFDSLETLIPQGKQTLFMNFSFIAPLSARYGSWGILETLDQDTAKVPAPKYRAIANYIRKHQANTSRNAERPILMSVKLHQNYPNPFNPTTQILFELPIATEISLKIFSITGEEVAVLDTGFKSAGSHAVAVDASVLASGLYIYRLQTKQGILQRKMVLIR